MLANTSLALGPHSSSGSAHALSRCHSPLWLFDDMVVSECRRFLTHFGQPCERECGQRHHDVAYRNVIEAGGDQVRRDAEEPRRRHVRPESCPASQNRDANGELDDAHDSHECAGRHRQDLSSDGTDVRAPVGEQIEELVDPGERSRQPNTESKRDSGRVQSIVHFNIASYWIGGAGREMVTAMRVSPLRPCSLFEQE